MNDAARTAALAGCGIVYFGNDWYAENRTSSHHVATRLARRMPVLYVDSPGMRAPNASGRDLRRAVRKLLAAFKRPTRVADGLWHCTVPQLPFRRLPGVDAFNRLFGRWAVRRALRLAGIRRRLSWFVVPHPACTPAGSARIWSCTTASTTTPRIRAWMPRSSPNATRP